MALTDHDTISGLAEAYATGEACGVRVVPGVEISASFEREVHLLGYFFDPDNAELLDTLETARTHRIERVYEICNRLSRMGAVVDPTAILKSADGNVGRPHIARALVESGHARDLDHAFDRFIGNDSPAYVPASPLTIRDAISLIHRAGGITSIAHPGVDRISQRLGELKALGLDAVEIRHPGHNPGMRAKLVSLAATLNLGTTGGSDLHHPESANLMGHSGIDLESLRRLEQRAEARREMEAT